MLIISNFNENYKRINLSNNTKILGFFGVEKQDIIIFLARISCNLGHRVLIIDNAREHAPPAMKLKKIEQRKVDFMQNTGISSIIDDYDMILINFGLYGFHNQDMQKCSHLFIVTDLQIHNIFYISEFFMKNFDISTLSNIKKSIILRDVVKCKIKPSYIFNELKTILNEYQKEYILFNDEVNYKNKIICQYDTMFKFSDLTKEFSYMLIDILVCIGIEENEVKKAYKTAKRGD